LILAGETLFAGGDDRVAAFDATTGKMRWSARVTGKAHGLAVAHGRLFVSTDRGTIHCFSPGGGS
jgi:outer membrane protein assembly factor BamB